MKLADEYKAFLKESPPNFLAAIKIVEKGFDVNYRYSDSHVKDFVLYTPLYFALKVFDNTKNAERLIHTLIDRGADLNPDIPHHPINVVLRNQPLDTLKKFIEMGMDPSGIDFDEVFKLRDKEIIEFVLENNYINYITDNLYGSWEYATTNSDVYQLIISDLIKKGADINFRPEMHPILIIENIVDSIDVERISIDGSYLETVCSNLSFLISQGAKVEKSAIDIAKEKGIERIEKLLLDNYII